MTTAGTPYSDTAMDYQTIIDRYYPSETRCREIYMRHAEQVATLAVQLARRCHTGLNENEVRAAAMLHDIGIFLTDAPGIDCHGTHPYIAHGILGADLLRNEGVDEAIARVAERHTGAGIDENDIDTLKLPLPRRNLMPETLLEKVVCYADKFYSKSGDMQRKPLERVINSMRRLSPASLERFMIMHRMFSDQTSD